MSEARFIVSDVYEAMAKMPDNSVDLIVTSPPFLALRSYLPADHPDKGKEIGSEPTPAAFLSTLLALTREWRRILTPTGSLCVELGDTYSGSGGAGGDYDDGGLRDGQPKFKANADRYRGYSGGGSHDTDDGEGTRTVNAGGPGWPMSKSLCMIPQSYAWALAYGRNPFDSSDIVHHWRVRNLIVWHRPNPPVGALGDKVRPSTSYVTVACTAKDRWFDLDSERGTVAGPRSGETRNYVGDKRAINLDGGRLGAYTDDMAEAGAPPLDCWFDDAPDADVWTIPTAPYAGTTSTVRRVPCGPDDGGERTTSPDCPRHAGLPGQLPKALRDERAGSRSSRISRNGQDPEQGQLLADATSDSTPDHSDSSPAPTSAQMDHKGSGAATRHDTGSSRTGRAPSTSRPDTPSVETARRTGRTPTSPESVELHHDTPASSTSSDGSAESPEPQTESRIAGNPSVPDESACTCSFFKLVKESTSHYATFPPALPRRLINLMCPRQVCTICGEPRRRITSVEYEGTTTRRSTSKATASVALGVSQGHHAFAEVNPIADRQTLGWSDCGCSVTPLSYDRGTEPGSSRPSAVCSTGSMGSTPSSVSRWRRGIVLDPFAGSGTTLQAASELGRDSIGLDLDSRNLELARQRLGMFLVEEDEVVA